VQGAGNAIRFNEVSVTTARRLALSLLIGLFMPYLGRPEVDALLIRLVLNKRFWRFSESSFLMYGLFFLSWIIGTGVAFLAISLFLRLRAGKAQ
jgi:hypothetical protein